MTSSRLTSTSSSICRRSQKEAAMAPVGIRSPRFITTLLKGPNDWRNCYSNKAVRPRLSCRKKKEYSSRISSDRSTLYQMSRLSTCPKLILKRNRKSNWGLGVNSQSPWDSNLEASSSNNLDRGISNTPEG